MIPIQDISLKVRNFKCFSDRPHGFETIKPINIIIGRNNSGKSTLLDLISHAIEPSDISDRGHKGAAPETLLSGTLTEKLLREVIPNQNMRMEVSNIVWTFDPAAWSAGSLAGKNAMWRLSESGATTSCEVARFNSDNRREQKQLDWVLNRLRDSYKNPFRTYQFRRIVADRDISPENSGPSLDFQSNGAGVTNAIQRYINHTSLPSGLVEETLLRELNTIFHPDANYTRILVQQTDGGQWEIHLEEPRKGRVPMSQTGSGLKTVLLVLANLLLAPKIANKPLSQFIFGFEELENNLHPAIQRRLFHYLREKAIEENCHFFLTTHSNVVIDLFSADEHAQLLHVKHDGECASVDVVETSTHGYGVLDDLDVRASDLLQTNAVVWVEGPSDRLYFNHWIELWSEGTLVEGVHYQCLPFGGSSNAHLSFESPEWIGEMIAALRINRHAIVLMDSDRRSENDELKKHTQRLSDEVKAVDGYAWITAGKEVENYIPTPAFRQMFANDSLHGPGVFADVLEYVKKRDDNINRPQKVALAKRVIPHITREAIADCHDMSERLTEVCQLIKDWNRFDE